MKSASQSSSPMAVHQVPTTNDQAYPEMRQPFRATPSPHDKSQTENAELIMTAATALTSLTRQSLVPRQGHGNVPRIESRNPSNTILTSNLPPVQVLPQTAELSIPLMNTSGPPQSQRKGQRQKATRFPVKLMQILSAGQYEHIISWTPDGLSFVVKKPSLLVNEVLPFHFKEVKYSSFTRKLHRWGFVKILRGKELSAYFHKNFRRGDFDLCTQMHCSKASASQITRTLNYSHGGNMHQDQAGSRAYQPQQQQQPPSQSQHLMANMQNMPNRAHYYNAPPMPRQPSMINRPPLQYMPQMAYGGGNPMPCVPSQRYDSVGMNRPRDAVDHKRIMENAWNALSWENRGRTPHQGKL